MFEAQWPRPQALLYESLPLLTLKETQIQTPEMTGTVAMPAGHCKRTQRDWNHRSWSTSKERLDQDFIVTKVAPGHNTAACLCRITLGSSAAFHSIGSAVMLE